jgi:hypothetical protein
MYPIGTQVVVGHKTAIVSGYDFDDGEMLIGLTYTWISIVSGRPVRQTVWLTEEEMKAEGVVTVERGEVA